MATKKKVGGFLGGLLAVIIGVLMLWFNEGNNVKNIKAVEEARENVIQISSAIIDSNNNGKLVATNGKLNVVSNELIDAVFGINVKTAKLQRKVEMYQWKENKEKDSDGNDVYQYEKVWSEDIFDSDKFKSQAGHVNPEYTPYSGGDILATDVRVGDFSLTQEQISRLSAKEVYSKLSNDVAKKLKLNIDGNYYTTASSISSPEIGDIRISFNYNNSSEISLLGKQENNKIIDYVTTNGKVFNVISDGINDGQKLLSGIEKDNNIFTWILRVFGIVFIILGIAGTLNTIFTFLDVLKIRKAIPILDNVINTATGLVALLFGTALGLFVIAIAWIRFRPIIGIGLIILSVFVIVLLGKISKKNKKEAVAENEEITTDSKVIESITDDNDIL